MRMNGEPRSNTGRSKSVMCFKYLLFLSVFAAYLSAQTGGPYDLTHSVIAGGGGSASAGGSFIVSGTVGQNTAGTTSTGSAFGLQGGFWFHDLLPPTAAGAAVGGRVLTPDGRGLRNASVTITDSDGVTRSATTSSFGYYRFEDVTVGGVYILSVRSKLYQFALRVIYVQDDLTNIDLIALE